METDWQEVEGARPSWTGTGSTQTYTYIDLDKYDEYGVLYEYRVVETVPGGYDVYYVDGVVPDANSSDPDTAENVTEVTGLNITNVERGELTVSKQVTGNRGNYTRQFDFSVTFTMPAGFNNANGWPTISYTKTDAEGKLTTQSAAFVSDTLTIPFTLADDDSITFTNLPVARHTTWTKPTATATARIRRTIQVRSRWRNGHSEICQPSQRRRWRRHTRPR